MEAAAILVKVLNLWDVDLGGDGFQVSRVEQVRLTAVPGGWS